MIHTTFIKPILSIFATVVFVFSAVPEIVFHDLFADHNYKSYYHIPSDDPHFDPPSASCDCVCDWYDHTIDNSFITEIKVPSPYFIVNYYESSDSYKLINDILFGLRGPPSTHLI